MPQLPSFWFGAAGDFLTFIGGVILAWDLINAAKKFQYEMWRTKTVESLVAANIPVQDPSSGDYLKTKDEVHLRELRKTARGAALGVIIITVGVVLQIIARFLESGEIDNILHFLGFTI